MNLKKCKPTGKASNYESCGKQVVRFKYGMCKDCYVNWCLNTNEGQLHIKSTLPKAKKKVEKDKKKEVREAKENIKSLGTLTNEAQVLFNKLIRLIDEGKGCISCGHGFDGHFSMQKHAGHYHTVGGFPELRFNAFNVHLQCSKCNNYDSGNIIGYNEGLKEVYGDVYYYKVVNLKSEPLNLTKHEVRELKTKIRELIKRTEKGEIITRTYINEYLKLY